MSLAPHHNKLNANNLEERAELHPAAGLFREEGHYLTGIQFVARTANNKPLFKHPIRSEHSHTAAYSGNFSDKKFAFDWICIKTMAAREITENINCVKILKTYFSHIKLITMSAMHKQSRDWLGYLPAATREEAVRSFVGYWLMVLPGQSNLKFIHTQQSIDHFYSRDDTTRHDGRVRKTNIWRQFRKQPH